MMRRPGSDDASLVLASSHRGDRAAGATVAVPLLSIAFGRAYLTTMRPYLLFVSGITGLAGMALAPQISALRAVALFAACFLSYGFGQALTDCSQTDTDALSSPYRPLVRGEVGRGQVLGVSLLGLLAVGAVLTVGAWRTLPLVALAVAGLATYTWFKRRWWGGPFYNAWIVALLLAIAWLSASGASGAVPRWPEGLGASLATAFFGYANFVLAGYFKDLSADRATGYRTFPVVFGFAASALVSDLIAAAAVVSAGLALSASRVPADAAMRPAALLWFTAGVGVSIFAQYRLHGVRSEREAHRAITPVLHAYLLLLGAVALAFRPAWMPLLLAFHAAFLAALRARPMRAQI